MSAEPADPRTRAFLTVYAHAVARAVLRELRAASHARPEQAKVAPEPRGPGSGHCGETQRRRVRASVAAMAMAFVLVAGAAHAATQISCGGGHCIALADDGSVKTAPPSGGAF